jgi:hypothetical protein
MVLNRGLNLLSPSRRRVLYCWKNLLNPLRADFDSLAISIGLGIKNKRAAQGRRSGNHCGRHKIPREISGSTGLGLAGAAEAIVFAFCSPMRILLYRLPLVKN